MMVGLYVIESSLGGTGGTECKAQDSGIIICTQLGMRSMMTQEERGRAEERDRFSLKLVAGEAARSSPC